MAKKKRTIKRYRNWESTVFCAPVSGSTVLAMANPIWKEIKCPAICTDVKNNLTMKARNKASIASVISPVTISNTVCGSARGKGINGVSKMASAIEAPAFHRGGMPLAPKMGKRKNRILTRTNTQKNNCNCSYDSIGNGIF